jgi:hypothetical protein
LAVAQVEGHGAKLLDHPRRSSLPPDADPVPLEPDELPLPALLATPPPPALGSTAPPAHAAVTANVKTIDNPPLKFVISAP